MLTREQLEIRKSGVSGSEIASVAGLSPYASALDVYLSKVGELPERTNTEHMMRGTFLGPALVKWYEAKTGNVVTHHGDNEKTLVSPLSSLVIATPDGLVHSYGRSSQVVSVLECKAPHYRTAHKWGDNGTDEIPDEYVPQVIWEMAAADVQKADIAALIGGELQIYHLKWDEELYCVLIDCAEKFWRDHVLPRIPPLPSGLKSHSEYIAKRFPRNEQALRRANDDELRLIGAYSAAKRELDFQERRVEELKQQLQQSIGSAGGIECAIGKISWKYVNGRKQIDWEAMAHELGANDELIAKHTKNGNGYRRFVASLKEAA